MTNVLKRAGFAYLVSLLFFIACKKDELIKSAPVRERTLSESSISFFTYSNLGSGELLHSISTSDNKILSVGYITGTNGSMDGLILKTDTNGVLLWYQTIEGTGNEMLTSVCEDVNGNLYVTGRSSTFSNGGQDVIYSKLNSYGTIIFTKHLGGNLDDFGNAIVSNGQDVFIAASTYSYGHGDRDMWLIKLNSDGNFLKETTIGSVFKDGSMSMIFDNDHLILLGYEQPASNADNIDFSLNTLDTSLSLIWQKRFGTAGYEEPHSICNAFDGGFLLFGHTAGMGDPMHDAVLYKTDNSGNLTLTMQKGGPYHDGGQYLTDIENSYWAVIRSNLTASPDQDIVVVRINKEGGIIEEKRLNYSEDDVMNCIVKCTRDVYLSGHVQVNNTIVPAIIRIK